MKLIKKTLYSTAVSALLYALPLQAEQHHHGHHSDHQHGHDYQQTAHEHGIAEMQLTIVENDVLIEVKSPLYNVLGFEHKAKNSSQKSTIAKQLKRIESGELITLDTAAQCQLTNKHIHHPFKDELHQHDHKEHAHHKHSHNEHHGHDNQHNHAAAKTHRDLSFEYQYRCANPKALKTINSAALFSAWSHLSQLRVEWIHHNHQSAMTLTKTAPVIAFE